MQRKARREEVGLGCMLAACCLLLALMASLQKKLAVMLENIC
jgi:hypothetical protein